jgi:hypothetical protein
MPEVLTALRVLMATASEVDAISPELTQALEEDKVCAYTRYSRCSFIGHHNLCTCAAQLDGVAGSATTVTVNASDAVNDCGCQCLLLAD